MTVRIFPNYTHNLYISENISRHVHKTSRLQKYTNLYHLLVNTLYMAVKFLWEHRNVFIFYSINGFWQSHQTLNLGDTKYVFQSSEKRIKFWEQVQVQSLRSPTMRSAVVREN